MLHAAVVPVHGHPVVQLLPAGEGFGVVRVAVAQEVPAGARPLGHGVGFPLSGGAALGAGAVHIAVDVGQGALAVGAGLEVLHVGQAQGQFFIGHSHHAAVGAVNQRDGLAPVALAVEGPVLHLILHTGAADALLFNFLEHTVDGILLVGIAVEEAGVNHLAIACIGFLLNVAALDDLDDFNAELPGKLPVALVVGGHGHDGAGAVTHHHIVGDENRHLPAGEGIHATQTLNAQAGLVLHQLGALELGLLGALLAIGADGVHVGDPAGILVNEGMLGRHDHEGHAEEGIRPCGVDFQAFISPGNREAHERAGGLADPVDLLLLDVLGIIHGFQPLQQFVGILGNPQIPHVLGQLHHVAVADVALAALAVLVGQHHLAGGAVVHQGLVAEHHAMLKQLQENPLRPLVIVGVGGVHLAGIVEGEANLLKLLAEVIDILLRHQSGMHVVLDGIVLRGQAEGVPPDGEQHVVALHAALAGDDVHGRVGAGMAHMQAVAGGIGELNQPVKLGLGVVAFGLKGVGFLPLFLPFGLDGFRIIGLHLHGAHPPSDEKNASPLPCKDETSVSRYHSACPESPGHSAL